MVDVHRAAKRWDQWTLAQVVEPLPESVVASGTLLRPPATEESIRATEARMRVELPPSYRTFLSISDGAYADWAIPGENDLRDASSPHLGLLPVGEVARAHDLVPDVLDMWMSVAPDFVPSGQPRANKQDVDDLTQFPEAIVISSLTWERGKYFLCLVPAPPGACEEFELWDRVIAR